MALGAAFKALKACSVTDAITSAAIEQRGEVERDGQLKRAVGGLGIDGGHRGGHVERDLMLAREDRNRVGANLVRCVAIGSNTIGTDDDEVDLALSHQCA